ncbi:Ras homolog enriched in brain [Mytilus galloprovincialis]|uniref:Ras homolog enriched in brain n=1 Tax=Mytilus galloprovincialis TaxID=29158 RepID=A0A8B6BG31_MYTGA|nr:Ras homolog enriched in brain [Mytilus galloprovincialis]
MAAKQKRIALMGFRSVGKSSVTIQFIEKQFVDSYDPTIENTFHKNLKIKGQEYALEVVDTAGQDEYSILPQSYYISVDGYVLVYSVNSRKSFDVIKIVYDKLLDMKGSSNIPVVLVGNKNDLQNDRVVSVDEGKKLASEWNTVNEVFIQIVSAIERAEGGGTPEKPGGCSIS